MAWLTYKGWRRGLVREITTLLGVLAGIWAATHMSEWICETLELEGESKIIIAFFIAFVGALVLAYLLGQMIEKLMKAAKIGLVNHICGATVGLLIALCILSVILNNIVMLDKSEKLITSKAKEESVLYKPVWHTGNKLTAKLKDFIEEHKDEWQSDEYLHPKKQEGKEDEK